MIKSKKSIVAWTVVISAISLIIIFLMVGLNILTRENRIDLSLIKTGSTSITKIYYFDYLDRKNRVGIPVENVEERLFFENSEWISIHEMNRNLINAFISIEDKRFYQHSGVDWLRTSKAIVNHVFKIDKNGYGGSTITQQLIKNLTGDNKVSIERKIKEIFRAINLEKELSKNEILESYLNIVYLSQNCYGVSAASNLYFNKSPEELSIAECATLASIVQNPKKFDPYLNPKNNEKRRNIVLKEMLNQGYISIDEYERAIEEEIVINKDIAKERSSGVYSWYTEAIIDEISQDISENYNVSKETARKLILKGGLNIYSTMNPKIQKNLEGIYEKLPAYIDSSNGTFPESSCVIIDPFTSDIIALVGGKDKKTSNLIFNRATNAKRPPGSVLKPLSVYSPGIEENLFNYSTVYDDTPLKLSDGKIWPQNSPNRYRGLVPICYAVERSINTVAVKALLDVGIDKSVQYLNKFGITISESLDKNESSLALGQLSNGETLLNITNAYSAFVNGGKITKPSTYLYVTDNFGNLVLDNRREERQVISEKTSYIMTRMLKNVVDFGTASGICAKDLVSIAGKTGTSSDNCDKWFIGYTPNLVCGVWTGFDNPKPMSYSSNPSCRIFDEVIKSLYSSEDEYVDFPEPLGIIEQEFCFDSGMIPKEKCLKDLRGNRAYIGYYTKDNIPKEECNVHIECIIDSKDGLIAEGYIPFWRRRRVSLLNIHREKQDEYSVMDSEYSVYKRKRK